MVRDVQSLQKPPNLIQPIQKPKSNISLAFHSLSVLFIWKSNPQQGIIRMSNPEHLKILKQGVEAWNKWREENPDFRPNLSGADLREAHLVSSAHFWPEATATFGVRLRA
jgi:hypothetical protein